MGDRTSPCGTPDVNWHFVDEWFLNGLYAMQSLDVVCDVSEYCM